MLYLIFSLFLGTAQASELYSDSLLLSELPNGARLVVSVPLELGLATEGQHEQQLHYCSFENGKCVPSYTRGVPSSLSIFSSYNTQINLRTDVEDALTREKGGFFLGGEYTLNPGIYCLNRSQSSFRSGNDDRFDKLRLTDCDGSPMFTLYARAGYNLRNSPGFKGFTVGDFHFQSGKTLLWIR